jgi:hypothetical protein
MGGPLLKVQITAPPSARDPDEHDDAVPGFDISLGFGPIFIEGVEVTLQERSKAFTSAKRARVDPFLGQLALDLRVANLEEPFDVPSTKGLISSTERFHVLRRHRLSSISRSRKVPLPVLSSSG